jgi:hypothetical protein
MDLDHVTDEIYQMILDNLHITYEPDEYTKRRIENEAASGIAYIKKFCDPDADLSPGTRFGQMLCDYVMRAESGDVETFSADFADDITAAKVEFDTNKYAEAMGYVEKEE